MKAPRGFRSAAIGIDLEPHSSLIEPREATEFFAATNQSIPNDESRLPDIFIVVPTLPCFHLAAEAVVPEHLRPRMVHGSHDIYFHRQIEPGMPLVTHTRPWAIRTRGENTYFWVRYRTEDSAQQVLVDQFGCYVIREYQGGEPCGYEVPSMSYGQSATGSVIGSKESSISPDQSLRYARASGDDSVIHMSDLAAREAGLPGMILQGLCTMAICGNDVRMLLNLDRTVKLKRLALRFSGFVLPGTTLTTMARLLVSGERATCAVGFTAKTNDGLVIKDGIALFENR